MVVMLFLCIACGGNQKPEVSNEIVDNRGETPRLRVNEITTLISDSGITRYRITAPKWLVFDKAENLIGISPKVCTSNRSTNNFTSKPKSIAGEHAITNSANCGSWTTACVP